VGVLLVAAIMALRDPSSIVMVIGVVVLGILAFLLIILGQGDYADRFLKRIGFTQSANWGTWAVLAAGLILPTVGLTFITCGDSAQNRKRILPPYFTQDASIPKYSDNNPHVAIQPDAQIISIPDAAHKGRQCRLEIEPDCSQFPHNVESDKTGRLEQTTMWSACAAQEQSQLKLEATISSSSGYDSTTGHNRLFEVVLLENETMPCLNGTKTISEFRMDDRPLIPGTAYAFEFEYESRLKKDIAHFCFRHRLMLDTQLDNNLQNASEAVEQAVSYSNVVTVRRICE
jgi:hypothetical protein